MISYLGWGLRQERRWQSQCKVAEGKWKAGTSQGLLTGRNHFESNPKQIFSLPNSCDGIPSSFRALKTTFGENAIYLRRQGCLSYSRHQELDAPQQLHPSAKSHLQILWQTGGSSYDTAKYVGTHPSSVLTSYIHLFEWPTGVFNSCTPAFCSYFYSVFLSKVTNTSTGLSLKNTHIDWKLSKH